MPNKRPYQLLFLIPLTLAIFFAFDTANAQTTTQSAPCSLYNGDAFSVYDTVDPTTCAQAVFSDAPALNGYAFGRWSNAYLAVDADGNTYVHQGRGWRFWQTVTFVEPVTEAAPVETAGDADGDGIADEDDSCVDSAENINGIFDNDGCPDTLNTLLSFVADDLNAYWQAEFDEANITYRPVTRITSYTSPSRRSSSYNAYYSTLGHRIAFDTRLMNDALNTHGDAAPVYILAHEFGHAVQAQLGLLGIRNTIYSELEADCLAGAYMQHVDERGMLDSGDVEEAMQQAYAVGDFLPHDHDGAHGSPEQRASAFELGFTDGVTTCLQSFTP